jgi:hypothetical protein
MARLEIPALYRLDLGHSGWGWHKMTDLTTAVNNLIERSPLKTLTPDEIGKKFVHLNREKTFTWSDEQDVDVVWAEEMQWSKPNLFVPAQWGLRVIDAVKCQIKKMSGLPTDNDDKIPITDEEWEVILAATNDHGVQRFLTALRKAENEPTKAYPNVDFGSKIGSFNMALKNKGIGFSVRRTYGWGDFSKKEYKVVRTT